jgi:localization factor PodJL
MQPDRLWNVGGIPPEAREAARAAARREGLPVGEWLTRRILRPASANQPTILALPESWRPNPAANAEGCSGTSAEVCERPDSTGARPNESATPLPSERPDGRHEHNKHGLGAGETPARESQRIADATLRGNPGTPGPAEALARLQTEVALLAERQRQIEQKSTTRAIKDAITQLHAGLSKLNAQATRATRQTDAQISGLCQRVESLSSRIELNNCQTEITALQVKDELAGLGRRVDQLERLNLGDTTAALRSSIRELGTKVIEAEGVRAKQLAGLKKGLLDLGTHIASSNVEQKITQLDKRVSELSRSGDRALVAQKLSDELARLTLRLDSAEATYRQQLARLQERLNPAQPPKPDPPTAKAVHKEFHRSAMTQEHHQSEPEPALRAALPRSLTHEALPSPRLDPAFSDFTPIGQSPAAGTEPTGVRQRGTPSSQADSRADSIRLRNIAITSVTVLFFAFAAAYFLYQSRVLASQLPSQQYLASTTAQKTHAAAMAGIPFPAAVEFTTPTSTQR